MKTALKIAIIAIVFVGSLMGLIEIKGETLSGKKLHKMVFIESAADWSRCALENARVDDNVVRLIGGVEAAGLVSNIISPGFPFDELILSWNAGAPDSGSLLQFEIEVSADSLKWHRFDYQAWGPVAEYERNQTTVTEIEGVGKILTDYLVLESPMRFARAIVRFHSKEGSADVALRRLAFSFASKNSSWDDFKSHHSEKPAPAYEATKLAVPYFSQRNLPGDLPSKCCSPTSVCMVLNYYGKEISPEECARMTYDPRGDIYGNWPHNAAAAFGAGLGRTWVESHCGFDEIYDDVASGKPVVISVAYGYDQLPHSPIHETTEGHLIVVVGFDGPNTVICNDPAGHNVDDGIVRYPRKELEEVWINHGGIAYHLWLD